MYIECLNPRDSFFAFDKEKLIHLAHFYCKEFSTMKAFRLGDQLEKYFLDISKDDEFSQLIGISDFVKKMVESIKYITYPLACCLLKLSLILCVTTTTVTVKRTFFVINIIKNQICYHIGDELLNDCLVT